MEELKMIPEELKSNIDYDKVKKLTQITIEQLKKDDIKESCTLNNVCIFQNGDVINGTKYSGKNTIKNLIKKAPIVFAELLATSIDERTFYPNAFLCAVALFRFSKSSISREATIMICALWRNREKKTYSYDEGLETFSAACKQFIVEKNPTEIYDECLNELEKNDIITWDDSIRLCDDVFFE